MSEAGKGDRYRPVDPEKWARGYRRIFGQRCELCGGETVQRHCKIVCTNCGRKRDCSDP